LVADKSRNNPGISFYYDLATSATHQLAARQNDFYFSKPVTVNGVIRTNNTSAFGTYNSKGTAGNLIYCSSDDRVIIGTSATGVYGNTDIYAGDFMKFHANSNSDSYKAIALELFREQSDNHRTVLRPATNSGAYLGTTTYRFNTAFFTNAITASDLKEKDVIEDFDFKVKDFIMGLEPIAYRRKGKGDTGERIHIGLGAQTLAKHIKDLNLGDLSMVQASIIDGENEKSYHGEDIDDELLSWGINYTELTPYLILMIKEQQNEINSLKNDITSIFIKTQNLIISSYFDKAFYQIHDLEGVETYRRKLYNFKDYLGSTEGYTYFNDYYVNKMIDLEDKYNLLENGINTNSVYLVKKKKSKILAFFKYIRSIFVKKGLEKNNTENN